MSVSSLEASESHRIVALNDEALTKKMSHVELNMIVPESVLVESFECLQLI